MTNPVDSTGTLAAPRHASPRLRSGERAAAFGFGAPGPWAGNIFPL